MASSSGSAYGRWGKRATDVIVAGVALVALVPALAAIAAAVRWRLGAPVLFRQVRAGRRGAPFEIVKFRSMSDLRDSAGMLLPGELRLTRLGRWLRRTSVDELPQLWNIVVGDMSFVGPRPLFVEYLPYYSADENRRHDVRPGLTGLAQVRGRNTLEWEERLGLDVEYVDRCGAVLDLQIVLATVAKVVRGSGIVASGETRIGRLDDVRRPRPE